MENRKMELRLLTLNLHCLAEKDLARNQRLIADKIIEYDIDVVLLQEVAQSQKAQIVYDSVKSDNYALALMKLLAETKQKYYLYYEPIKESFTTLDEGLGIISKNELKLVESKYISKSHDYANWKTRKTMVYLLNSSNKDIYLATTHFGWSDGYEVFEEQFDLATLSLRDKDLAIFGGDFNIREDSKEYSFIKNRGWIDFFHNDDIYHSKATFSGDDSTNNREVRLDYFVSNKALKVLEKEILFTEDRVSDHYGVYVKVEI